MTAYRADEMVVVNALDGIAIAATIPDQWEGWYVLDRTAEACDVLKRQHMGKMKPKEYGTVWPAYDNETLKEFERLSQLDMGQLVADGLLDARTQDDHARWLEDQNETPNRPTSVEIARMEHVIAWPGRYLLRHYPARMIRSFNLMAEARSRSDDVENRSRKYGIFRAEAIRLGEQASNIIADGLNSDNVEVS